jgi:transcriptional regulator of acetoin/glycerol metabolism
LPAIAADANAPLCELKRSVITRLERDYLARALVRSGGNVSEAARASGKARRAFFALMTKYGIRAEEFRERAS